MLKFDRAIFRFFNRSISNPFFDRVMPVLTNLHHVKWLVWIAVAVLIVLVWRGGRRGRVWVLCAILAVSLADFTSSHIIKAYLHRDRPCYQVDHIGPYSFVDTILLGGCPGSYSFPSNHASNTMAVGLVCWWFARRKPGVAAWKPGLWFLLPFVIGFTRVYVGDHYPSDVLGGWVLGALAAYVVLHFVARRLLPDTPAGGTVETVVTPTEEVETA